MRCPLISSEGVLWFQYSVGRSGLICSDALRGVCYLEGISLVLNCFTLVSSRSRLLPRNGGVPSPLVRVIAASFGAVQCNHSDSEGRK
jgi:hypothetical protein